MVDILVTSLRLPSGVWLLQGCCSGLLAGARPSKKAEMHLCAKHESLILLLGGGDRFPVAAPEPETVE